MPDLPISGLTADASPTDDDLLITVNAPGGTPGSRKVTLADMFASSPFVDGVFALVDTDTTLAADSDSLIPSQAAVKAYVDAFTPEDAVLVTSSNVHPGGDYWDFVVDEDDMASDSDSKLPTQQSVKAYVDASAGGGDVDSTDTDVTGWGFVIDEDDMSSDLATKLPTQQSTKAYVDALPTLTTSDTSLVPVTTSGGVTILDVSNLTSSSVSNFADAGFSIYNSGDNTIELLFSATGTTGTSTTIVTSQTTDRVWTLPDSTATAVGTTTSQTLTNKIISGGVIAGVAAAKGVTISGDPGTVTVNDLSRLNAVELFVSAATGGNNLAFMQSGGPPSIPTQTASAASIMRITGRGYTNSAAYSTGAAVAITGTTTEAVTTSARGAYVTVSTTPTTTTTLTEAVRFTADTIPGAVLRGVLALGAGSGMASATSGLQLEMANSGGLLGLSVGTMALSNGANADVTCPTNNIVFITGPTGAFSLSGIVAPPNGKGWLMLINRTGQNFTLTEDATSTAANRIITQTGADQTTTGDGSVILVYDSVSGGTTRWVKVAIAT